MAKTVLEFCGEVKVVGASACLINVDGVTAWIADSEADYIDEPEEGKEIRFTIPEWLAINTRFL